MASNDIMIINVGMATPVGVGAAQTYTSVRAGINRYQASSVQNKRFEPMTLALLPEDALPPLDAALESQGLTSRQARMLRLGALALTDMLASGATVSATTLLFLGVPETLPGRSPAVPEAFPGYLARQARATWDVRNTRMYPHGRAAGLVALYEAVNWLRAHPDRDALVGAVDSYLDLYLLGMLDMEERVMAPSTMDGFVPGEAACFMMLRGEESARRAGTRSLARIKGVALGQEAGHRYSEAPYKGEGLATVVQNLCAQAGTQASQIKTVYAGYNGESFFAKEWGVTYLRSKELFADPLKFEHPADCFGDAGAALGLVLAGLGAMGMNKNQLASDCLVWSSADRAERAAALIGTI